MVTSINERDNMIATLAYKEAEAVDKALKAIFKHVYVVYYEIIGDRCNGSWLVKAKNKTQARKLIRAQYDDYVVREVQPFVEYCEDMGVQAFEAFTESIKEALEEDNWLRKEYVIMPNMVDFDFVHQLECGT